MFGRDIVIKLFWAFIFFMMLIIIRPINNDKIIHGHNIIESDYTFDIKNLFQSKDINTGSININTGIFEEIQNDKEMHGAAEDRNAKFQKTCSDRQTLCDKVTYTDISDKNKYFYQSIINFLFNRLDSYSKISVSDNMKIISVNGGSSDRRGYAGRTKLYINPKDILSYFEFLEVLTHEAGHIVDLGVIKGSEGTKLDDTYTEFNEPSFAIDDKSIDFYKISRSNENTTYSQTSYKDFVSGYGMSNPFEDYAECQNMYMNHQDAFIKMAENSDQLKSKFEYIQNIYNTKYIQNDDKNVKKISKNSNRRPRDTTRIR